MEDRDNIFAKLILEKDHLDFLNESIDKIYGDNTDDISEIDSKTLDFLFQEVNDTEEEITYLKSELLFVPDLSTGKIEIEYKDIPDDVRFELYHILNSYVIKVPGFSYHTVENTTKYSKDFTFKDE